MRFHLTTIQNEHNLDLYMVVNENLTHTYISLKNKHDVFTMRNELHAQLDLLINKFYEDKEDGKQKRHA